MVTVKVAVIQIPMETPGFFPQSSHLMVENASFSTNLTSFPNTTGPSTEMSQGLESVQTPAPHQGLQNYPCDQTLF